MFWNRNPLHRKHGMPLFSDDYSGNVTSEIPQSSATLFGAIVIEPALSHMKQSFSVSLPQNEPGAQADRHCSRHRRHPAMRDCTQYRLLSLGFMFVSNAASHFPPKLTLAPCEILMIEHGSLSGGT